MTKRNPELPSPFSYGHAMPQELQQRIQAYEAIELGVLNGHAFIEDGLIVEVVHTAPDQALDADVIEAKASEGLIYTGRPLTPSQAESRRQQLEAISSELGLAS